VQSLVTVVTCEAAIVHAMKTYRGNIGIAPLILRLGARRRWAVSTTLRSLWAPERSPLHWL